jgi:TRAP-type C4-dicarboxylate transport system substrate-binding protein
MTLTRASLLACCAIGISAITGSVQAQSASPAKVEGPKVKWDLSTYGNPRSSTHSQAAFSRLVSEATNGNFQIEVHYGGGLAPEREIVDGLKIGAYQMGYVAAPFHPGKTPAWLVLELPGLPYESMEHLLKVTLAVYEHPAMVDEMARWNAYHMVPSILPFYELIGRGEPVKNLADLKGKRVRALGGTGAALRKVGVVPTSVVTPEIYGGFDRGLLDGAAVGLAFLTAYKLQEVTHWYSNNLRIGTAAAGNPVNRQAFDALPPQYKKLLKDMVVPASLDQIAVTRADDAKTIETARAKGMKEVVFTRADLEEFRRVAGQPVWEEWVAEWTPKGVPARALLDHLLDQAKRLASS